jgi:hypothetical protein
LHPKKIKSRLKKKDLEELKPTPKKDPYGGTVEARCPWQCRRSKIERMGDKLHQAMAKKFREKL